MKLRELKLVKQVETLDELNQPQTTETTETSKTFIVELRSISRAEFFEGRRGGLAPSFSFVISAFDYDGEKLVEYNGNRYAVYRTYETDDDHVELYCQEEGGVSFV